MLSICASPSEDLSADIADKTIAHYDISRAFVNIVAFDVAVKIKPARAQQLSGRFTTSLPLMSSSPMLSNPTLG